METIRQIVKTIGIAITKVATSGMVWSAVLVALDIILPQVLSNMSQPVWTAIRGVFVAVLTALGVGNVTFRTADQIRASRGMVWRISPGEAFLRKLCGVGL